MLAEIFLVKLQMLLRNAAASTNTTTTASDTRFVPITLPRASKSKAE